MSVRLRPIIRCSFNEDQNILRITLKESVEQKDVPMENWLQEVVIYALKVGVGFCCFPTVGLSYTLNPFAEGQNVKI